MRLHKKKNKKEMGEMREAIRKENQKLETLENEHGLERAIQSLNLNRQIAYEMHKAASSKEMPVKEDWKWKRKLHNLNKFMQPWRNKKKTLGIIYGQMLCKNKYKTFKWKKKI